MTEETELVAMLCQPTHGVVEAESAQAFYTASCGRVLGKRLLVHRQALQGSLLAMQFNAHWCWALNHAHQGNQVDYFAMLHGDVAPEPGWLDRLIEALDESGADVMAAVSPIKTQAGLTSTAVSRDDGDNWRTKYRLTMDQIYRLPDVFTSEDVGGPLLVNTGCWVARFDLEWARLVHFQINDAIGFNTKTNTYQALNEPEDWYFSRLLHEQNLKVAATRRVALDHLGKFKYSNRCSWGTQTIDEEKGYRDFLPPQPIPAVKFPLDVPGWLLEAEGQFLADLAEGKQVLEIGSYLGRSTICLAQHAKRVVSVDPHDGRGTPKPASTRVAFLKNLERYGVFGRVKALESLEQLNGELFDLVFIDGAHDGRSVAADLKAARQRLAPGGLLAVHDYRDYAGQHDGRWDPAVTEAVQEMVAAGGQLHNVCKTVAVLKPPAMED